MPTPASLCRIYSLPSAFQTKINRRIQSGESDQAISDWLENVPETCDYLSADEDEPLVSPFSVSQWRKTGYTEWAVVHDLAGEAKVCATRACNIAATGLTTEHIFLTLIATYAAYMRNWDGTDDSYAAKYLRGIRDIAKDIVVLCKCEHVGQRLALDREKFEFEKSKVRDKSQATSSRSASMPHTAPSSNPPATPTVAEEYALWQADLVASVAPDQQESISRLSSPPSPQIKPARNSKNRNSP